MTSGQIAELVTAGVAVLGALAAFLRARAAGANANAAHSRITGLQRAMGNTAADSVVTTYPDPKAQDRQA